MTASRPFDAIGGATLAARHRGALRNAPGVLRWMARQGISPEFAEELGVGLERSDGGMALTFPLRACDGHGRNRFGRLPLVGVADGEVEWDGRAGDGVPTSHWSAPPGEADRVVVVPDILTSWLMLQALGHAGCRSPLVLTSSHPGGVPDEWADDGFWSRFASITLLSDGRIDGEPVRRALFDAAPAPLEAIAPDATGWRGWLSAADRPDPLILRARLTAARPLRGPDDIGRMGVISRRAPAATDVHLLDDEGRLRRVVLVEEAGCEDRVGFRQMRQDHRYRRLVVRSDRTVHVVGELDAPSRTAGPDRVVALGDGSRLAAAPCPGSECSWSYEAVLDFLSASGAAVPDAGDLLAGVAGLLVGLEGDAARIVAGHLMLTYVYQAFPALPVLWLTAPPSAWRTRLIRRIATLAHGGVIVPRGGQRYARLAHETGGTLVFEEPGCVAGPGGPNELGLHLQASSFRDGAGGRLWDSRGLVRPIRKFGPCIVIGDRPCPAGLADVCVAVDLETGACSANGAESLVQSVVDDLYAWSMDAIGGFSRDALADRDHSPRRSLEAVLTAAGVGRADAVALARPTDEAAAAEPRICEADLLPSALAACIEGGAARHVSITQLMLEAALANGGRPPFPAERVGRWMMDHGGVDSAVPTTRRRLHGHIARIYALARGEGGVAEDALRFCLGTACGACRYAQVCGDAVPGLQKAKTTRLKRG